MRALGLVVAVIALASVLHRAWRSDAAGRRALRLDLAWASLSILVTRQLTRVIAIVVAAILLLALGDGGTVTQRLASLRAASPVSRWPMALQLVAMVVLADLAGYWIHRGFHRAGWAWRAHAIHHAPTELTWLGALRVHPLNDLVPALVRGVPLVLLGFPFAAVAALAPALALYALLLHADVPWRMGWLRFVIATPRFHRWHHARDAVAVRGINFAGLLPLWDLLFRTFHLPAHAPAATGVGHPIPDGLLAQLRWPLQRGPAPRQHAPRRTSSARQQTLGATRDDPRGGDAPAPGRTFGPIGPWPRPAPRRMLASPRNHA